MYYRPHFYGWTMVTLQKVTRGQHISNNCLIGAVNAYNKQTNMVKNQLTGEWVVCIYY
jgi:hypothetical protein